MIGASNQQTENGMNVATRGQERQYGDADQIEAKVNEWLSKIDVNEVLTYIEIDEDADHTFAKASSTNSPRGSTSPNSGTTTSAAVKAAASSEKRTLQARRNTRRQSSRRQIFGLAVIARLPSAST